jgi:hypothetical protein
MKVNVCRIAVSATLLLVSGLIPRAFAATVAVGTCTNFPYYTTIQTAVTASPAGSTIEICPGTYAEQVTINKKLTLMGVANSQSQKAPVIVPPSGGVVANTTDFDNSNSPIAAQILVQNTTGVVLDAIAVDGASNGLSGCGTDIMGILFQNASGTVENVAVRNQTLDPGDAGCQSGEGIFVETQSPSTSTVVVESSSVHNYQKNGITGNDIGTSITITLNDVQGWGPTPSIAQNGIQVCCGATGSVTSNLIIDDVYTGPSYGSSGILLYDTLENSGISVSKNKVGNTQLPVVLYTDEFAPNQYGDGVTVSSNKIFGAIDFDAIDACTNGNTITSNTVMNSWDSAIHLDASCSGTGNNTGNNNMVTSNIINEGECAGILADSGTTGNTTTPNTFYNVTYKVASSTTGCSFAPAGPGTGHRAFSPKGRPQKNAQAGR